MNHLPSALEINSPIASKNLLMEKRKQLAEAASELFETKGYHNTTVAEIAQRAEMSIGSIYRYVTNKRDILVLIFVYMNEMYDDVLDNVMKLDLPPWDKLSSMVEAYYRVIDKHSSKILLAYRYTVELSKEGQEYAKQQEVRRQKRFGDVMELGIKQGVFKSVDTDILAFNIVGSGQIWAAKRWHLKRKMTLDDYISFCLSYLWNYIKV